MAILFWILFGLIAGAIAKFLMPGKAPGGILVTIVLGIIGAVVGGLVSAARPRPRARALCLAAIGWGIAILAAAAAPSLPLELAALVFVGYGSITFNSLAKTTLQLAAKPTSVPATNRVRPRISSSLNGFGVSRFEETGAVLIESIHFGASSPGLSRRSRRGGHSA